MSATIRGGITKPVVHRSHSAHTAPRRTISISKLPIKSGKGPDSLFSCISRYCTHAWGTGMACFKSLTHAS